MKLAYTYGTCALATTQVMNHTFPPALQLITVEVSPPLTSLNTLL